MKPETVTENLFPNKNQKEFKNKAGTMKVQDRVSNVNFQKVKDGKRLPLAHGTESWAVQGDISQEHDILWKCFC